MNPLPELGPGGGRLRTHLSLPLFRHGYTLLIGSASTSVLGLAYWLIAARTYPVEIVGVGAAALSALMLVSGLSQLGLTSVLVRYLPSVRGGAVRLVARSYAAVALVSVLAGAIGALAAGGLVSELGFLRSSPLWIAAFALSTVCWSIFALQDSVLTALRLTHWVTFENTLFALVKIVLLLAFAAIATDERALLASWLLPAGLAVVLVSGLIFLRALPEHHDGSATVAGVAAGRLVRFATGNYAGSAISLVSLTVIPVLVTEAAGATANAHFYVPWSIFVGVQLIAVNLTTSLTVEVARDAELFAEYCRRTLVQLLRIVVPVALVLVLAAPYLLRVFGASYEEEGTATLRLLAVAAVPNVVVTVGIGVARLRQQGWLVLIGQAVVAGLGVGLTYALLPEFGIEATGLAWLVAQLVMAAAFLVGPFRIPVQLPRRAAD